MELKLENVQLQIPSLDLRYLKKITNQVGIIQHAKYSIPDYHHGYSIDDNARALMLCNLIQKIDPAQQLNDLIDTYLSYIYYMQREDGQFGNFLSFKHEFLDVNGTEDSFGRTIWALGSVLHHTQRDSIKNLCLFMLQKAIPQIHHLKSIKAVAYTLSGLVHLMNSGLSHHLRYGHEFGIKSLQEHIEILCSFLINEYKCTKEGDWHWFENILCYDNGIVPYSLFIAHQALQTVGPKKIEEPVSTYDLNEVLNTAIESTLFLDRVLFDKGSLNLIGNQHWYIKNKQRSYYGEQPVDIPGLIICYTELEKVLPEFAAKDRKSACFAWLFGENRLSKSLYDDASGGCFDGIEKDEINLNQGAESVISFWQAYVYYFYHLA